MLCNKRTQKPEPANCQIRKNRKKGKKSKQIRHEGQLLAKNPIFI